VHALTTALSDTWPPFVLVAGLLLIGHVASAEGLFRFAGTWCARVPGGDAAVLVVTLLAVALVSALLNLDTAVVFMTPVALQASRARKADETAFLYGAIFMSNSASLLLLGSNLTNLLVFAGHSVRGSAFTSHTWSAWLVSVALTIAVVVGWRWRPLRSSGSPSSVAKESFSLGPGVVGTVAAVAFMLLLSQPALWVLGVGLVVEFIALARRRTTVAGAWRVVNLATITGLFVVASAVGWFARGTTLTAHWLHGTSVATTVALGTLSALVINNLPAASLFAAHGVTHPYALLLGLDLGPNLFVTGALSSLLWWRIAHEHGARPRLVTFALVGTVLGVAAMAASAPLVS